MDESIISISEIVGTIEDGAVEVCATADARYAPATGQAVVDLGAFARHSVAAERNGNLPEPWLPRPEQVTEHLPLEEVDAFARDVFHGWVHRVRGAVPHELSLRF